jgi:hypothetical protein
MEENEGYNFLGQPLPFSFPVIKMCSKCRAEGICRCREEHLYGLALEVKRFVGTSAVPKFFVTEYLDWLETNIDFNSMEFISLGFGGVRTAALKNMFLVYLLKKTLGKEVSE